MLKAIIFDLGGVILDLDIATYRTAMSAAIGKPDIGNPFHTEAPQFFYDLERGQINPDEFVAAAKAHAAGSHDHEIDEAEFLTAFNSIVGGVPRHRLDFVDDLRDRFQLYLLSNTNALHAAYFEPMFEAQRPGRPIASYFDEVFYSHELGERKPDRSCYDKVLAKTGLVPAETLFIDDLAANIKAANALGIRGHHLTGELTEDTELRRLLGL